MRLKNTGYWIVKMALCVLDELEASGGQWTMAAEKDFDEMLEYCRTYRARKVRGQ